MSGKPKQAKVTSQDEGDVELAKYLDDAHYNANATRANLRSQYDVLARIDHLYGRMIRNMGQSLDLLPGFFFFRTHSAFRAAIRLCLSGQLAETYMVLRGCLESALYGLFVAGNTNRQEIWLCRHDDAESALRVKRTFTIGNLMKHLKAICENTQHIAQKLYDLTIDQGGHPNERAVMSQISVESSGSRVNVTAESFHLGDLPHRVCLKMTARVGVCCFDIFSGVFRDQYRMLGIVRRLNEIRRGL